LFYIILKFSHKKRARWIQRALFVQINIFHKTTQVSPTKSIRDYSKPPPSVILYKISHFCFIVSGTNVIIFFIYKLF